MLFSKSLTYVVSAAPASLADPYSWFVAAAFLITAAWWIRQSNQGLRLYPASLIMPLMQVCAAAVGGRLACRAGERGAAAARGVRSHRGAGGRRARGVAAVPRCLAVVCPGKQPTPAFSLALLLALCQAFWMCMSVLEGGIYFQEFRNLSPQAAWLLLAGLFMALVGAIFMG